MTQALYLAVSFLLGAGLALQVAMLGAMSRHRGPAEAAWVSLLATVAGLAFMLGISALAGRRTTLPTPFDRATIDLLLAAIAAALLVLALSGLRPYFGLTGLIAVPFLVGGAFLGPRLGIGLYLATVIAGQLAGAVVIDHVGAFGAAVQRVDAIRLAGVVVLLVGVALIRGVR